MNEQRGATLALQIESTGESIWATVRPEDEERLRGLIGERTVSVSLDESAEVEGHAADTLFLDVEGHALALRLPTGSDAAALRRGFAVGVVTASLVIGGAAAAIGGGQALAQLVDQPQAAAPAAPAGNSDSWTDERRPDRPFRPLRE